MKYYMVLLVLLGLVVSAGASAQTTMTTDLRSTNLVPTSDPYCANTAGDCATSDLCSVTQVTVNSFPQDVVDWVLVEVWGIQDPSALASIAQENGASTCLARQPALLLSNGRVVDPNLYTSNNTADSMSTCGDIDGDPTATTCPGLVIISSAIIQAQNNSSLHLVIRHRNHLSVLSAEGVLPTTVSASDMPSFYYDFSATETAALGGTLPGGQRARSGVYAMYGGDANGDGEVQVSDYTRDIAGDFENSGYLMVDVNLDGVVDINDYTQTVNSAAGAATILGN